jgi:hypothetical protein
MNTEQSTSTTTGFIQLYFDVYDDLKVGWEQDIGDPILHLFCNLLTSFYLELEGCRTPMP